MEELEVIEVPITNVSFDYPDGIWVKLDWEIAIALGKKLYFSDVYLFNFNIEGIGEIEATVVRLKDVEALIKPYQKPFAI